MGRQTLPNDVRKLTGSAIRTSNLFPGQPTKPQGLSEAAGRYWDQRVDQFTPSGIALIPGDSSIVAQCATIKADLQVAWAHIQTDGRYVVTKTGVQKIHPAVEDTARLNEKLSKCLWQLGLTQRSRGNPTAKATELHEREELDDILGPINSPTVQQP